jgi:hypothetical protein
MSKKEKRFYGEIRLLPPHALIADNEKNEQFRISILRTCSLPAKAFLIAGVYTFLDTLSAIFTRHQIHEYLGLDANNTLWLANRAVAYLSCGYGMAKILTPIVTPERYLNRHRDLAEKVEKAELSR